MRIVIEIEGIEVTAKVSSEAKDTTLPQASSPSSKVTTAALGAQDAGAAPAAPVQVPGAPQPFMMPGIVSQIAGPDDLAAGAAPGMPSAAAQPGAQSFGNNAQAAGAAPGNQGQAPASDETGSDK
jgi:hypothetical protein